MHGHPPRHCEVVVHRQVLEQKRVVEVHDEEASLPRDHGMLAEQVTEGDHDLVIADQRRHPGAGVGADVDHRRAQVAVVGRANGHPALAREDVSQLPDPNARPGQRPGQRLMREKQDARYSASPRPVGPTVTPARGRDGIR